MLRCESENEFHIQIDGVVTIRAATRTIIVGCATIEACISGILRGELQILPSPIRQIRDIPSTPRAAIGKAAHRTWSKQQGIASSAGIEPAEGSRKAIAEMVFGIGHNGIEMVQALGCRSCNEGC